tara:strand:+ start:283 stop:567 length:285 start_codon:yes stop_codon:yes gene_type:complete
MPSTIQPLALTDIIGAPRLGAVVTNSIQATNTVSNTLTLRLTTITTRLGTSIPVRTKEDTICFGEGWIIQAVVVANATNTTITVGGNVGIIRRT